MEENENKVLRVFLENNEKREPALEKFSNLSLDIGKILLAGAVASDVFSQKETLTYMSFSTAIFFLIIGSLMFVLIKFRERGK